MRKVILYIAANLNGFIARADGNLDWLITTPPSASGGDYGYSELLNKVGTIIMRRKTYQEVLKLDANWRYSGFTTYIVNRQSDIHIQTPDTYLLKDNFKETLTQLKKTSAKDIWLVGDAQLITAFINEDLLDIMILTVIPKIIHEGIPLFAPKPKETDWKLTDVQHFDTGLVNLTYNRQD